MTFPPRAVTYQLVARFERAGCANTIDVYDCTRREARRLLRLHGAIGTVCVDVRAPGYREVRLTYTECPSCAARVCAGHDLGGVVRSELSLRMQATGGER